MKCEKCGYSNKTFDKHCRNCGTSLKPNYLGIDEDKFLKLARIALAAYMIVSFFTLPLLNLINFELLYFLLEIKWLFEIAFFGCFVILAIFARWYKDNPENEFKQLLIYYAVGLVLIVIFC